jgi:hypothetical protein
MNIKAGEALRMLPLSFLGRLQLCYHKAMQHI